MEEKGHVVALAFPFGTHAAPVMSVLCRLAALSPATRFSFLSTRACISSATKGVALPPNLVTYAVRDGVPDGHVAKGGPMEEIEMFLAVARRSFEEGMERAVEESGRRVTCLVTDAFFWFGREVADRIGGVHWVTAWGGPAALSAHLYTDFLRESLDTGDAISGREDEFLTQIPGMSKIKVGDLPEGVVVGQLDSPFSEMLHKMSQNLPLADAMFLQSFEELAPEFTEDLKSKLKGCLNIGPLSLAIPPPKSPDAYNCIEWLDKHRAASVAYIGFGSMSVPPPHELVSLADALEARNVPFLWSLKDSARVHLPDGFLERTSLASRGLVVPWAPQMEILRHEAVGVFITHGGWNSVVESVVGGVPMICRPFFGDHKINARMVEDVWGIGVRVKGGTLTVDGVTDYLNEVLFGENGKKMRDAAKTLQNKAIVAVEPQGSSSNNFRTLLEIVTNTKKL
nr:flavonoid 3-O-galactosyltransferase GAT [Hypericum monogynum]